MKIFHKAYVYLTCGPELLVFEEADNPRPDLQVPGGTLDPGESYLQGAIREFSEETGLTLDIALESFADQDHFIDNVPGILDGLHRRRHFHGTIPEKPADEWEHFEMTPSAGGAPIRFRLFWVDMFSEEAPPETRFLKGLERSLKHYGRAWKGRSMGAVKSIGVIGGGAWGTALALTAARAGTTVRLWARDPATVSEVRTKQQNTKYLPGITFDEDLNATSSLKEVADADAILLVAPAQSTRAILSALKETGNVRGPVVLCAKGIEQTTGKLLSQVMKEELPGIEPGVLSGPSFADDVAKGLPTAVTVAAHTAKTALSLCEALQSPCFRPYASIDVLGTQIGGALKNVLAIACGAVAGRKLGASAQAALTARGFAELNRLGSAMGAQGETLTGLSGLGDLVLTCSSTQSRNFSFGMRLGEGFMASELIAAGGKLAEGAYSAQVAVKLAQKHEIEVPICDTVARMVSEDMTIDEALNTLMARPLKSETDFF